MKLIGFLQGNVRYVGALQDDDTVVPIAPIDDFYADSSRYLAEAPSGASVPVAGLTQVPPVPETTRVFCVGLNYLAHAEEANAQVPDYPTVFGRWASTLVCDGESIPVPAIEKGLDWEVELAVIVGETLTDVDGDKAMAGVLGYTVFNDISARDRQFDTTQWTLGKNPDRSGPIGPVVVTADEMESPNGKRLTAKVNGELMQDGNTSDMIFSVSRILSYISQTSSLRPGDVVATGTPSGVGFTRTPPKLLTPGDVIEVEIEGIGVLRNPVTDAAARP
ncbi:2-keto-4-pentenoate hydratase/2-oxohepta-3-ene-1,7-dioic acid hydratase (catechol pathway) [Sinosporangium album]|uniref:2-keto-4-pentenoate hydratase/2-oxohepta-3-ene-1,7-dioic acid hydratase (Catechol pathway) n=1 Tax=Sinosporangium album TaxID=504805 RepID=A0A1G8E3K2_9ACTN|nr:fumarylacetoacetate hydrolase family protein [Sinosporangium album]SDH64474.1 2-keto-4-pentenoate hydratase/2-oxohepta-3-ene-1,7-dioic acid hydratase (catechol pathway) [Sinosporangium album]